MAYLKHVESQYCYCLSEYLCMELNCPCFPGPIAFICNAPDICHNLFQMFVKSMNCSKLEFLPLLSSWQCFCIVSSPCLSRTLAVKLVEVHSISQMKLIQNNIYTSWKYIIFLHCSHNFWRGN